MNKRNIYIAVLLLFACFTFAQTSQKFSLEQNSLATSREYSTTSKMPELVVQEGHNETIEVIQFSADGKYLLTAEPKVIKIWDVRTGLLIKSINKFASNGSFGKSNVAFAPNGKFCVYINKEESLECYDFELDRNWVFDSKLAKNKAHDIAFAPNGKIFAVANGDFINIYDSENFHFLYMLSKKNVGLWHQLVFDNTSKYLLADSFEGVQLWDVEKRFIRLNIGIHSKNHCFSENGKYIALIDEVNAVPVIKIVDREKIKIVQEIEIHKSIYSVQFSKDNEKLFAVSDNFFILDFLDGRVIGEIKLDGHYSEVFTISPDEKFVAIGFGLTSGISIFSLDGYEKVADISAPAELSIWNYDDDSDTVSCFNKHVSWIYNEDNGCVSIKTNMGFSPLSNSIFKDGVVGVFYDESDKTQKIGILNFSNNKIQKFKNLSEVTRFFANSDSKVIVFQKNNKVYIYDVEKQKSILKYETKIDYCINSFLSPSKQFAVNENILECYIEIYMTKKNKIKFFEGMSYPTFSNDDKYCAMQQQDGGIVIYETSKWSIIKDWKKLGNYKPLCFSHDKKNVLLLNYSDRKSYLYSIDTGKTIKTFPEFEKAVFNYDDSKIIGSTFNDLLYIYSAKTKKLLCSVAVDNYGDWLSYTPEGYFNGNEGGINNFVHLVNGMEVSELGQYAETFFRPDIVAAKLRGEDISKNENFLTLSDIAVSGEAPIVQFTQNSTNSKNRDITVNFSVQDMGGGIGSVYLKLNDKVIQLADGSRKLELVGGNANTAQKTNGKTTQFSHLITLQNGENTIEAYATNSAGVIESRHATTKISWKGNTAKPNLYVLAVGVNKYRDKSLWLNYAVPDATSIADSFKSVKGNLYGNVSVSTVFDADVTSLGIAKAFDSLSAKVTADDVFIFYLSGHGTAHTDGDYYFIPVDFRFRNADSIVESGLSKHFITENLSKIKAQKTLVMLDTCNSGAFISTGARGMAEKTAIDRLSRATGQATIAASSDTQCAMEGYEGHGIFTYVILEALSGKADVNKDGYVSLAELSAYAEEKVPDYSYSKWGYEQFPQVDLRKQANFPLVGR